MSRRPERYQPAEQFGYKVVSTIVYTHLLPRAPRRCDSLAKLTNQKARRPLYGGNRTTPPTTTTQTYQLLLANLLNRWVTNYFRLPMTLTLTMAPTLILSKALTLTLILPPTLILIVTMTLSPILTLTDNF